METGKLDCGLQTTQNDISGWATPTQRAVSQDSPARRIPRSNPTPSHQRRYSLVRPSPVQPTATVWPDRPVEEPARVWTCRTMDLSMPLVGGRTALEPSGFPAPSRRMSLLRKRLTPTTPHSPKPRSRLTKDLADFQAFLATNKLKRSKPLQRYPLGGVRRRASQYHFDKELVGVSAFHRTIAC